MKPCRLLILDHGPASLALDLDRFRQTLQDAGLELGSAEQIDVFGGRELATVFPPEVWGNRRVRWHERLEDLGDALRALQPSDACDVAWVRAGLRLLPGWREKLAQALYCDEHSAIACPLVMEEEWLSPLPTLPPGRLQSFEGQIQALATWLALHAPQEPIAVDQPSMDVGLLKAEAAVALARAAHIDEATHEQPWFLALAAQGWSSALSRQVLAWGAPRRSEAARGQLLAHRDLWRASHPLTGLRHAVAQVWGSLAAPPPQPVPTDGASTGTAPPPVRLHISHSWGGGLSKWVQDFNRADRTGGHGVGLVLRSVGVFGAFGQRLTLHAAEDMGPPLRFWELGVPIHATAASHPQVRDILREIINDFGVEHVLVSSLIGHSLDVLRTGLPTVMVAHDHHPFCVALYATFQGECRRCDRERLSRCINHNPEHRFFKGVTDSDWMVLRSAFVQAARASNMPIVAPSRSVALRWQEMMPALNAAAFRVIEHGLDLQPAPDFRPPHEGPLRLVVLGRLSPEKGSSLLLEMLPELLTFCELWLVGCGERTDAGFRDARIHAIPEFDNATLPLTLAELQPHLGLLISTVPETFSYTLSELWHCGIPVVATNSGALQDRIEHGVTGFLEPLDATALLRRIRALDQERDVLLSMRQHIKTRPLRTTASMVGDYDSLLPRGMAAPASAFGRKELQHRTSAMEQDSATAHARARSAPAALHVNPEVTWRQAAQAFWHFTCTKASRSPRLPPFVQRWFSKRAVR